MKREMELFIWSGGNGTCVSNKKGSQRGCMCQYEDIAHISDHGVIQFYVDTEVIPDEVMEKIQNIAERSKAEFMEKWNRMDKYRRLETMLDIPVIGAGYNPMEAVYFDKANKDLPFDERYALVEQKFFETHM